MDGWARCAGSLTSQETGDRVLRKESILIVEPDDLIRPLLERWLAEAGFMVQTSSLGAISRPPSLIIANVSHPRDCEALVCPLIDRYRAPVILISALFRRGLEASVEAARRFRVPKVLPKPFSREELLAAVEEVIAGSSDGRPASP